MLYLRSQNQNDLDPKYCDTKSATKAGFEVGAKTELFAFFIYHATHLVKDGSRLGFVTSASWLTSDYAISLQTALLGTVRIASAIASNGKLSSPLVDVKAVLLQEN